MPITPALLTLQQRRRAQNRASQRAFRERKEIHVKGLQGQLEQLHETHQDLLQTYNKQSKQVKDLNTKIAKLVAELDACRSRQATNSTSFAAWDFPQNFDGFASLDSMVEPKEKGRGPTAEDDYFTCSSFDRLS